jgi:hypothetical protein
MRSTPIQLSNGGVLLLWMDPPGRGWLMCDKTDVTTRAARPAAVAVHPRMWRRRRHSLFCTSDRARTYGPFRRRSARALSMDRSIYSYLAARLRRVRQTAATVAPASFIIADASHRPGRGGRDAWMPMATVPAHRHVVRASSLFDRYKLVRA